MSTRHYLLLAMGWTLVASLLAPLFFALWVSFSSDSFLTPPLRDWSFRWYVAFFTDRRWSSALLRGLIVGIGAASVALISGVPLAFAQARYRFSGKGLLTGAALLPACIPPAVLAMGLLPLLFAAGLWGNPVGLILAHGLVGLPVVYLVVRSHLEQLNPDLEAAARGLGASPWQVTMRVTLPILYPALLAGAASTFAISVNESMLTLFLATPTTETLPAVIWPQLRYSPTPLVAVASCVSIVLALLALLAWSVFGTR